jgi:hypothetical protein
VCTVSVIARTTVNMIVSCVSEQSTTTIYTFGSFDFEVYTSRRLIIDRLSSYHINYFVFSLLNVTVIDT